MTTAARLVMRVYLPEGYTIRWRRGDAVAYVFADRQAVNFEVLRRLAGAILTLLEWHTINGKGKCRVRRCGRARRSCPVFTTVHFWMEQPLGIVQKVGSK